MRKTKSKYTVKWDDEATINYKDLWEYIAKDSIYYADKVGEEIEDAIEKLTTNPLVGPEEQTLKQFKLGHRYIVHSHYKIIYRISGDKIFISAIFDTRQRPSKLKKIVSKAKWGRFAISALFARFPPFKTTQTRAATNFG